MATPGNTNNFTFPLNEAEKYKRLIDDMISSINELNNKFGNVKFDIGDGSTKKLKQLRSEIEAARIQLDKFYNVANTLKTSGGIEFHTTGNEKFLSQLDDYRNILSDIISQYGNLDSEILQLDKKLQGLGKASIRGHNETDQQYNNRVKLINDLTDELNKKKQLRNDYDTEGKRIQAEIGRQTQANVKSNADALEIVERLQDEHEKLVGNVQNLSDQYQAANRELSETSEIVETINSSFKQSGELLGKAFQIIKDSTEYWRQQEGAIAKMSGVFGFTNKELANYRNHILEVSIQTEKMYGLSAEELVKLQQGYDEATSRAYAFTDAQIHAQSQLSTLMGEDLSIDYLAGVEKFGVGLEDARDLMGDIYNTAKQNGITSSKAAKDVVNNLKIAERYNFQGGLQNMKDMSIYAAKMRVDMEAVGNLADKISNPEGAIETAARLQVLGGNFAALANPLAMLYESLEDVGGLTERVADMFDGMGYFDKEMGEVRINGMDRQRIRAAAEAMGMSYEQGLDIARERIKRNQIEQDVSFATNLTADQQDLLKTLAQFNKKTGQFEVSYMNSETGKYETKAITEFDQDSIKLLEGEQDDIKNIVTNTFGINDKIEQAVSELRAIKANQQEEWFGDTVRNGIDGLKEVMSEHADTIGKLSVIFDGVAVAISAAVGAAIGLGAGIKFFGNGRTMINSSGPMRGLRSIWGLGRRRNSSGGGTTRPSTPTTPTPPAGSSAIVNPMRGMGRFSIRGIDPMMAMNAISVGSDLFGPGEGEATAAMPQMTEGQAWGSVGMSMLNFGMMGASFGPWGAAIGAAVGAIVGIVQQWDVIGDSIMDFLNKALDAILFIPKKIGEALSAGWDWVKGLFGFGSKDKKVDDAIMGAHGTVITNPNDSILAAKPNGPIDKLFDSILPKIDEIHGLFNPMKAKKREDENRKTVKRMFDIDSKDSPFSPILSVSEELSSSSSNSVSKIKNSLLKDSVRAREVNPIIVKADPLGSDKTFDSVRSSDSGSATGRGSRGRGGESSQTTVNFNKPLEVKINGTLRLESGGQAVDIMSILRNNPSVAKELAKMISDEVSASINGGRSTGGRPINSNSFGN